jgi:signal-transduction protein with cAMP-binding, CBS, and nucleotidyltransferase domain
VVEATVRDVMTAIRVSCPPATSLRVAAAAMASAGVGALVVTGERPGVLSERDLLGPIAEGLDLDSEPIGGHLRADRPSATPAETLLAVAERMTAQNVRHVLVVEAGEAVGMLSMRDVVRVIGKAAGPG